jgi:hypothetical protein
LAAALAVALAGWLLAWLAPSTAPPPPAPASREVPLIRAEPVVEVEPPAQAAPSWPGAAPATPAVPSAEPEARVASPAVPPPAAAVSPPRVQLYQPQAWSDTTRRNVEAALALLPHSVQTALGNPSLGPLYILVNREGRTRSGVQPYGRAANFYSTNEGSNEVVLYPDQSVQTVLHELGHAYNLRRVPAGSYAAVFYDEEMLSFLAVAGWRLLTPEARLRNLSDHTLVEYAYEGTTIWSRVSHDDPLEDFANSFALFFSAPQELARLSPARYAWFSQRFTGGAEATGSRRE